MALGVASIPNRYQLGSLDPLKWIELTFPPDDSYPTGGTGGFDAYVQAAMAAMAPGFIAANGMTIVSVTPVTTRGYMLEYDRINDKLLVYVSGDTEVANTTDLSAGGDFTVIVHGVNQ